MSAVSLAAIWEFCAGFGWKNYFGWVDRREIDMIAALSGWARRFAGPSGFGSLVPFECFTAMLPRTLEPEMSESMEEAEEYDTIDHSAVNQKFAEDFLSAIQSKPVEMRDCLDLGTGTALIPVEICKRNRALRIMATDASIAMLEFAKYRIEVASMLERIQLHRGDAKRLVFDDCNFDFVISNSLLHHIPDPAVVLREAWRVLRPGGLLFLRDLLRPDTNESVESLVTKHASNESAVGQQLLRQSLHAALSLAELGEMLGAIGIPPQTIEVSSDRHWTVSAWKE